MSSGTLFHENHPRRLVPELSAQFHKNQWFVGMGAGGFVSIKQGGSIYIAASNVAKDRMTSDDLYVYNANDSSITLSPSQDKKLSPCEVASQILLIFKERKGASAVMHCNGKLPSLASLIYSGSEFKMKNQGIIKGLYNEALKRNFNAEEIVTIPILEDLNQSKLKEVLQKSNSCNAVIIRNQGLFTWADDWLKCKAAAECYHQLIDISIEMEKFGINPYTTNVLVANVYDSNEVSTLSSVATLDEIAAIPSDASAANSAKKVENNLNTNSITNTDSVPSTSNGITSSEKPKQKNVATSKPTPTANKKTAENEKAAAKTPTRRQQNQNNSVKQGRVVKKTGVHKGGRGGATQGPNRRSVERTVDKRSRRGGGNQGPNRPPMGQPGPLMGGPMGPNGPMMNQGGPIMGGPHGTFTGGPANNGPPMGGPPVGFGGPQGPMMDGPMGPMGPGGPMGPMGPRGPMGNPMMEGQMRAAQHHASKQRNARGRGSRPGGAGQRRGDKKGGAKKPGEKNMPNKDVLMNY